MRADGIDNRLSRLWLFLLIALVPGVGCDSPAEPPPDVSAPNFAVGPPVQSITGSTALTTSSGPKRSFSFNARMQAGQPVTGRFSGANRAAGTEFSGRLTCLTILNGNEAWFAGVIEDANRPALINTNWGWRAVDGPDQVTFGRNLTNDGISPADFCDTTPGTPFLHPNESGSIRIQG